jgi:outer membrane receptor protein involved in Fe transport
MNTMSKIGFFVAAVLAAGVASAQEGASLEEVIVTAQKRVGTLQNVPVAVTAVSGDTLEAAHVRDALDLQQLVPSLTVSTASAASNTTFAIRSLGTSTFNSGLEGSVGIFVDGVYLARQNAAVNDFLSLDRVEVLRGPQATLFGRNTPAGVVSFLTKAPDQEFNGAVEVTAGNYASKILRGTVTGPITDTLSYRLDGNVNQRDGIVINVPDGRDLNNRNRWSTRGQLLFKPDDATSVRFIADFAKVNEQCCAAPFYYYSALSMGVIPALHGVLLPPDPFAGKIAIDNQVITQTESKGVSVQVDHKYSGFDLTSITAFREYQEYQNIDADFTTLDLAGDREVRLDYKTFTQEFRLASTGDGALGWQLGAFYYDNKLHNNTQTPYGTQLRPFADALTGGAITLVEQMTRTPTGTFLAAGQGLREEDYKYNTRSTSGFAQVDYHVNDKLTLTAGLRYTKENKNVDAAVDIFDPFSAINFVDFGRQVIFATVFQQQTGLAATPQNVAFIGQVNPGALAAINAGATAASTTSLNPFLGLMQLQFNPPAPLPSYQRKRSEDNLSGNFIVAYDATDNANVYVSWSRGFKAGGFNATANASITGVYEFKPEIATAIELGVKAKLFNNTSRLNLALFKQNIKDFQENIFTGSGFGLSNAGEEVVQGLEAEFASRPLPNLTLGAGFTYMFESKYKRFDGDVCYPGQSILDTLYPNAASVPHGQCGRILNTATHLPVTVQNVSGEDRGTPEWTANLNAGLTQPIGNLVGFVNASVYYVSEQQLAGNLNPLGIIGAITLVNASFGVRSANSKWQLEVWSRNLTDEHYLQGRFESVGQPGSGNAYIGDPRTYGVTLRARF